MADSICQMCGQRSRLIRAHIIPRSFYPEHRRGGGTLSLLSSGPKSRRHRSQMGVYDNQLVCAACERRFDSFDNYASKLLLDNAKNFETIKQNSEIIAYQIGSFDYEKMKLSSLSLLWRATKSKRQEFKHVQLGRFENRLTDMIRDMIPGSPQTFATIITRFSDIPFGYSGIIFPTTCRIENCKFYKFVMGSYVFYMKMDIGFVADPLEVFLLQPDRPLMIMAQKFNGGPEHRIMLKIVGRDSAAS